MRKRTQIEMVYERGYNIPGEEFAIAFPELYKDRPSYFDDNTEAAQLRQQNMINYWLSFHLNRNDFSFEDLDWEEINAVQPYNSKYLPGEAELDQFTEYYEGKTKRIRSLQEAMSQVYTHQKDQTKLYVYYAPPVEKELIKDISDAFVTYCNSLVQEGLRRAIFVNSATLSAGAKESLGKEMLWRLEFFKEEELGFNCTQHIYVDPHVLLSNEKAERLLKYYKITKAQLPLIHTTDPIVRYYGWEPDNIVMIKRFSFNEPIIGRRLNAFRYITNVK